MVAMTFILVGIHFGTNSGVRFSKDPKTLQARKEIRKTPTRLFYKAGLSIFCKGNKN